MELKEATVTSGRWIRLTATAEHEGKRTQRVIYCPDDPRSDAALMAGIQTSLHRYIGDELGVPHALRDEAWAAAIGWEVEILTDPGPHEGPPQAPGPSWDPSEGAPA